MLAYFDYKQNFHCCSLQFMGYSVNVVLPTRLPRTKISFFLLSTCTDELIAAPNIINSWSNPLPLDNEKLRRVSNPKPYPEYLYLSKSAFLLNLKARSREFLNVKLVKLSQVSLVDKIDIHHFLMWKYDFVLF